MFLIVRKSTTNSEICKRRLPVFHRLQYAHLPDDDFVQLYQPFVLGKPHK
jgi:hypothetical protein